VQKNSSDRWAEPPLEHTKGLDQLREIAANQDDIGALPRNVRSRPHGDANVGLYQG
jgi:hypothetical protein